MKTHEPHFICFEARDNNPSGFVPDLNPPSLERRRLIWENNPTGSVSAHCAVNNSACWGHLNATISNNP